MIVICSLLQKGDTSRNISGSRSMVPIPIAWSGAKEPRKRLNDASKAPRRRPEGDPKASTLWRSNTQQILCIFPSALLNLSVSVTYGKTLNLICKLCALKLRWFISQHYNEMDTFHTIATCIVIWIKVSMAGYFWYKFRCEGVHKFAREAVICFWPF